MNQKKRKKTIAGKKNDDINQKLELEFVNINDVPVAFCRPNKSVANGSLAVWIPYLGGNKETGIRELQQLANAGFFALSLDPWLHGDRKRPKSPSVRTQVFKNFRANMWPILGITTLDTFRVIDWAIETYNLNGNVVVGGLSMGGDIAIALAGIDHRISKVAAIGSTPDWTRPGMTDVFDSNKIIEQGNPTSFGKWLYEQLDPMTHRKAYFHAPKMLFELGAKDTHISPKHTLKFNEALGKECSKAVNAIDIVINKECTHLSLIQRSSIIKRAVDFLCDNSKGTNYE